MRARRAAWVELVSQRIPETESIKGLTLAGASHERRDDGMCAMEAVAWLAGEPHSDAPACTARSLRNFVITVNDWMNDDERNGYLKPFLPRLVGTTGSTKIERRASFMFADWATRTAAPLAMMYVRQPELAARLRAIPAIVDDDTAFAARNECDAVRTSAYATFYTREITTNAAVATSTLAYAAARAAHHAPLAAYAAYGAAHTAATAAYSGVRAAMIEPSTRALHDQAARNQLCEECTAILDRVLTDVYGR